jgi:hypothetical protein
MIFNMSPNPFMSQLREKIKSANRRLVAAMICYAVLILIVLVKFLPIRSANDRFLLGVVLLVFALLIIKTLKHAGDEKPD